MADCNGFAYQLIELVGLSDARESVILKATIASIDRENDTADITNETISDPPLVDNGVEFWYHCEFSTGTLDDLAFGHMAFSVGDLVYVAHLPLS